jgi:hypothetical protein
VVSVRAKGYPLIDYLATRGWFAMEQKGRIEKRASRRVTILQDVHVGSHRHHRLVDLSDRGMFVATKEPYMVGSMVTVRFRLSGDPQEIRSEAKVIYILETLGMGLQFVDMAREDHERIRSFIARC